MQAFNVSMSKVRESVEWLFNDVATSWKFIDFKKNLKIGFFFQLQKHTKTHYKNTKKETSTTLYLLYKYLNCSQYNTILAFLTI